VEPEYFNAPPQARRFLHTPVSPRVDATGQITEVAEYVDKPVPTNFLEVSTTVTIAQQHANSVFMDAVLTDDLEEEIKNVKPGEKFIHRGVVPALFFGRAKVKSNLVSKPEQAPSDLPQELSGVFQQLAEKYESSFQDHFNKGPPHPGGYDQHLWMNYEMSTEPQILLPVPASVLVEIVSKLREEMQVKPLVSAFVESGAKSSPGLSMSNYLDPFPAMIPASVLGGVGGWSSTAATMSARPPNFPSGGVVSLGVQSPPPPLRPDNLPPPPYISPLVVDKDTPNEKSAGTSGTPPK